MPPYNIRRISAHYIFADNSLLKRGVVTVNGDGTILDVEDTGGTLSETRLTEFYDGIIIPGFVNCHSHLELAGLNGTIDRDSGLPVFLKEMRQSAGRDKDLEAIRHADIRMSDNGIVLCGDTCNSDASFDIKRESRITYHNFIELFGTNPLDAAGKIAEGKRLAGASRKASIPCSVVPHSAYSVSLSLLRLIKETGNDPDISSIHFMESASESHYLSDHTGLLAESFLSENLIPSPQEIPADHINAIEEGIPPLSSLILVHNTFVGTPAVRILNRRKNTFWCICPNSNLYIENCLPPLEMMLSEGANPVIGTDSLASNSNLSILDELKTLQKYFPALSIKELVTWGCSNGARALKADDLYGTIAKGKQPGLLLLEGCDLQGMRLLPGSSVRRLL